MMIHTARVFDNRDTKEVRLPLPPFCRSDECIYLYIYIFIYIYWICRSTSLSLFFKSLYRCICTTRVIMMHLLREASYHSHGWIAMVMVVE